jgi:hypothetical protein
LIELSKINLICYWHWRNDKASHSSNVLCLPISKSNTFCFTDKAYKSIFNLKLPPLNTAKTDEPGLA